MTQRQDRRITRTHQLLRGALMELIVEKGYDQTTVQEILDRADVGRSTFYSHFMNKDELLYSGLPQNLLQFGDEDDSIALIPPLTDFFEHLEQQQELLRALIGANGSPRALQNITRRAYNTWEKHLDRLTALGTPMPLPTEVIAHYLNGAMMSLITWWLDAGLPHPAEDLSRMFHDMAMHGLQRLAETTR